MDYILDTAAHISLCTKLHLFVDVLCVLRITSLCREDNRYSNNNDPINTSLSHISEIKYQ